MPTYEIKCKACQKTDIIYRTIDKRDENLPLCSACKSETARVISLPMIAPDIAPFVSPNGKLINSRAEYKEDLRRSKAIAWEPGLDKDIAQNKIREQERAFEPIAKAVDAIVTEMNVCGKLETDNA
jgi:putative FmdB family regulatory protein